MPEYVVAAFYEVIRHRSDCPFTCRGVQKLNKARHASHRVSAHHVAKRRRCIHFIHLYIYTSKSHVAVIYQVSMSTIPSAPSSPSSLKRQRSQSSPVTSDQTGPRKRRTCTARPRVTLGDLAIQRTASDENRVPLSPRRPVVSAPLAAPMLSASEQVTPSLQAQMQRMISAEIARQFSSHEQALARQVSNHEQALARQVSSHEQAVARHDTDIRKIRAESSEKERDLREAMARAVSSHEQALARQVSSHDQALARHDTDIRKIRAESDEKERDLREAMERAVSSHEQALARHDTDIRKIRAESDEKERDLREAMERAKSQAQDELHCAVKDLNSTVATLDRRVSILQRRHSLLYEHSFGLALYESAIPKRFERTSTRMLSEIENLRTLREGDAGWIL